MLKYASVWGVKTLDCVCCLQSVVFNISRKYFEVEGFGEDTSNVQYMITEGPSHGSLALLFYDGNVRVLQPGEC